MDDKTQSPEFRKQLNEALARIAKAVGDPTDLAGLAAETTALGALYWGLLYGIQAHAPHLGEVIDRQTRAIGAGMLRKAEQEQGQERGVFGVVAKAKA